MTGAFALTKIRLGARQNGYSCESRKFPSALVNNYGPTANETRLGF